MKTIKTYNSRLKQSIGSHEKGFTLIEVLLSLSIVSLCVVLLSFFTSQSKSLQDRINTDRQLEWHLFLNQTEYELEGSTRVSVDSDNLSVEKENKQGHKETIKYQKYLSLLRRQVGGEGHQPMLTDLKSLQFKTKENKVTITVKFNNEETYSAVFDIPVKSEEESEEIENLLGER
ncbi:competence type IV pilus minor pilin ComGF [Marinilactibacillus sp. GCM10026970]|uniref:competence type IV pilus minor pilin ComGF n=1 Tax=Marinilactibacillus sp. GCM10026970 TaxID=3252642 RepID=UPI0036180058